MHEYSVVSQMIERLLLKLQTEGVKEVRAVHLRRGSTFQEGPIRQAFAMLSGGTPLANAEIVVDMYSVEHTCANCGYKQVVTADDLVGHMFICPECGTPKELDEAHALELVEVTV
jgi:Zn finger protein HypA/HybF involved in hydrogenase expression